MLLQPYLCIIVHDESVPAGVDVNVSLVILSDVLKKTSQAESHLPAMTWMQFSQLHRWEINLSVLSGGQSVPLFIMRVSVLTRLNVSLFKMYIITITLTNPITASLIISHFCISILLCCSHICIPSWLFYIYLHIIFYIYYLYRQIAAIASRQLLL